MILAPGVTFDEGKHEYWYKGKMLSGITGLVAAKLGLKYNGTFVGEHAEEGIHVHKAIQRWIETGDPESVHPGVRWLVETFRNEYPDGKLYSEVLVSDFNRYASAVDIILDTGDKLVLFDIKKGVFKRDYATWQLSVYKYFIENLINLSKTKALYFEASDPRVLSASRCLPAYYEVKDCVCICLKDKEYYPIFTKPAEEVEKLLYGVAV